MTQEDRTPQVDLATGEDPSATSNPSSLPVSEDALNRSRFLVSMGHTLRGPLNSILGFADILLEGTAGPLTDRQRNFVKEIAGAGERHLEIIDNLITLARHHSGEAPYHPQPMEIYDLLQRVVARFRTRAEERSITLLLDANPALGQVFVDPEGVERAIGNLLSNAIRHLEPGGVIRVAAAVRGPEGASAEIPPNTVGVCVADTGEGIDPASYDTLFDDLEQVATFDARRQQRAGTGLPLARRLLEREGGSISIQSSGEKGEGTRLRILLPQFDESTESAHDSPRLADALNSAQERGP
jgi:signal transduction histidine kinase